MKIVKLTAENLKKLRAVEITPQGDIVTISGRNSQGKTSVLDSIYWALAGTASVQGQPIRKGEHKARVKIDLGTIVVERKFADAPDGKLTTSVTVESADGARFPSPQRMLDDLVSTLSFDPLAFARMEPKRQADELRRVSKIEIDIDKLDAFNKSDYDKRTEINRDAKAKRAQAEGIAIPIVSADTPRDDGELVEQLRKAGEHNASVDARKQRRHSAQERIADLTVRGNAAGERVANALANAKAQYEHAIKEAAAALELAQAAAETNASDGRAMLEEAQKLAQQLRDADPLPELIDTAALSREIAAALALNDALRVRNAAVDRKSSLTEESVILESAARDITARMEGREAAKAAAIKAAAMPVPGLGFGDGMVTYNGLPFDQSSSAEQLRVSMAIAIAANPKLRVIRITDGSLLDEDSLKIIAAMAKDNDFQVWLEVVSSDGKVGIVIEDGAVASTPESRAEAATQGVAA